MNATTRKRAAAFAALAATFAAGLAGMASQAPRDAVTGDPATPGSTTAAPPAADDAESVGRGWPTGERTFGNPGPERND